jgi:hypothetical protein
MPATKRDQRCERERDEVDERPSPGDIFDGRSASNLPSCDAASTARI